jgi:CBF1 interacting corepressor
MYLQDMKAEKLGLKPTGGRAWTHGFLNQKFWHPSSFRNQEKLFKAEQDAETAAKRLEESAKEVAEEQEFFKNTELLSAADRTMLRNKQQLAFMYQKPPGYEAMLEKEKTAAAEAKEAEETARAQAELTEQRLAAGLPPLNPEEIAARRERKMKKDMYGRSVLTGEEMPEIKHAPRHDGVGAGAVVKMLGKELKAIQCLRCGGFGHSGTDKDCPMANYNPNDEFRLKLEDPLSLMKAREELTKMRKFELRTPMVGSGRSPTRGGGDPNGANQQLLHDAVDQPGGGGLLGQEDYGHGGDAQLALESGGAGRHGILGSLPKAERKRLIREYRAQEKAAKRAKVAAAEEYLRSQGIEAPGAAAGGGDDEREGKKSKKEKKEKRDKNR